MKDICYLKRLPYVSQYCKQCDGMPDKECYESKQTASELTNSIHRNFLKRFEIDNGSLEDMWDFQNFGMGFSGGNS